MVSCLSEGIILLYFTILILSYHLCLGLASGLMCSGFPIELQDISSDKQLRGSYAVLHSEAKFPFGSGRRC